MANVYSVKKISSYIESIFSTEGIFKNVMVKGEIGTLRKWDHGIIFLNLKEGDTILPVMLTSGCVSKARFEIKNGMTVTVVGNIVANPRMGSYKLNAYEIINEDSLGDAQAKLLELKKELQEEGLFDPQYKKPLPKMIKTLGFVTSQSGAVINDVIDVSKRRNPYIKIVMVPSKVSGDDAVDGIVRGIRMLEEYGAEVIIVGRGGGSDEDLWVYNNRQIAEAVFDCSVPVISAVGHSIDYTILDLVADERAVTPSEAAEKAVCDLFAICDKLRSYEDRLNSQMNAKIRYQRALLGNKGSRLAAKSPRDMITKQRNRLENLEAVLQNRMHNVMSTKRHALGIYIEKLKGLSPLDKLNQGYAYVSVEDKTLQSVKQVKASDDIKVYVSDGVINATVKDVSGMKYEVDNK